MEKNNGEQLAFTENSTSEVLEVENGAMVLEEASSLGKFANEQELLKAYNHLQAEFTRKSQLLAKMQQVPASANMAAQTAEQNQETNVYDEAGWNELVAGFLKEKPRAMEFAYEISEMLLADKELSKNKNALELAYNKVLSSRYKTEEELLSSSDFLSKVLSNGAIKQKVIENYLQEIQKNKAPIVIASGGSSEFGVVPQTQAKTLEEAKDYLNKLFK